MSPGDLAPSWPGGSGRAVEEWLDELDAVGRWQIRDRRAVLVVELPDGRVELTPHGRRCEVRADVPVDSLRRLLEALEALAVEPAPLEAAPILD